MSSTVAEMTPEELREMIESSIERKLIELFGDPDAGLEITDAVREQLLQQATEFDQGNRGKNFADVVSRLGLSQDHV
jgi:hypothetical protein